MTSQARRLRIFLGIIILVLSVALLIWGLLPSRREIRTQPISPSDLQLPTPTSLHFDRTAHMREGIAYGISLIAIRDMR